MALESPSAGPTGRPRSRGHEAKKRICDVHAVEGACSDQPHGSAGLHRLDRAQMPWLDRSLTFPICPDGSTPYP